MSRQLVYLQFGDRDSLLVDAAVDLVRRELIPHIEKGVEDQRLRALATARHFAKYRSFYRAMLTGSCAFAMTRTLCSAFSTLTRQAAGPVRRARSEDDAGHDRVSCGRIGRHSQQLADRR